MNLLMIVIYWPQKNRNIEIFYNSLGKLLKLVSKKDSS